MVLFIGRIERRNGISIENITRGIDCMKVIDRRTYPVVTFVWLVIFVLAVV